MPLVRELIKTDAENLESEVSNRIEKVSGSVTLFIADMREISRILARSEQAKSSRFLNLAGKLLLEVCGEQDRIYRIGDSTFGVLLTGIESIVHQQMAAEKISRLKNDAIREMGAAFNSNIRMGIASYPEDANNAIGLIHKARIALESAQSLGKNYVIYSKNSASDVSTKWNLQEELAASAALPTKSRDKDRSANWSRGIIALDKRRGCGCPSGCIHTGRLRYRSDR